MADLLEEKLKINEKELLDEGKLGNFVKAAALGAGLAISDAQPYDKPCGRRGQASRRSDPQVL